LVNSLDKEILPELATRRIAGMPLTVSEYCHPHPNQYTAEGLPLIAAFGAFQDWDGIFSFDYMLKDKPDREKVGGYFDMSGSTVHTAHMIACRLLFCDNIDKNAAKKTMIAPFSRTKERELYGQNRGTDKFNFAGVGLDPRLALLYPTALDLKDKTAKIPEVPAIPQDQKRFLTEDEKSGCSILFDMTAPDRGFASAKSPSAVLFTGFVTEGEEYPFGNGTIRFGQTNLGWSTVTLAKIDQKEGTDRMLLAATGEMANTWMKLESLDDDKITLNWRWGKEPVRCEGIPTVITLKKLPYKNLACWSLDESGKRKEKLKTISTGANFKIELKPEYKTVWYEIVNSQ
jgi:hypothetical protein